MQHVACVWPPSCDLLCYVGCCWLKFENGQIFPAAFVNVAWCCSRLTRFVQQCYGWACTIVRFSTRNMSQHVATGWPNVCSMFAPNNVAICCVQVLRSFGRYVDMLIWPICWYVDMLICWYVDMLICCVGAWDLNPTYCLMSLYNIAVFPKNKSSETVLILELIDK